MARADNAWSRWVVRLKIILPLIALGLLSSLFLLSRTIDPTAAIPFSEVDVEDRARAPRLTAPTFSGLTRDGASVTVTASDMRPDPGAPRRGTATNLTARMKTPDGVVNAVRAAEGRLDTDAGTFEMVGDVSLDSDAGYRIAAPRLAGRLDATLLDLSGGVSGETPIGSVIARTLTLRPAAERPGRYLLVFKGGVRLVYRPQT